MEKRENDKERKELANRLRQIRENMGYTQESFSELLEISTSAYKKIESTENQITLDGIRRLEKKLNISADYLLFGKNADFEQTWKLIENSSEHDKLYYLMRLVIYFSHQKKKTFLPEEFRVKIDEKLEEIIKIL